MMTKTQQNKENKMIPYKLKVTPSIKVGEIFECEGSFFYLNRQKYNRFDVGKVERYFLRVVVKKDKIDKVLNIVEKEAHPEK